MEGSPNSEGRMFSPGMSALLSGFQNETWVLSSVSGGLKGVCLFSLFEPIGRGLISGLFQNESREQGCTGNGGEQKMRMLAFH